MVDPTFGRLSRWRRVESQRVSSASFWKDDVRQLAVSRWATPASVDGLFEACPHHSRVLDDYTRFLYHIGEGSLPGRSAGLADASGAETPVKLLKKPNTAFMLESLHQPLRLTVGP